MGFYPVTPGLAEYRVGSPLFDGVTIHLSERHHEGNHFVIEAPGNGPDAMLVREASLDGRTLDRPVLAHDAITAGGLLRLQMAAVDEAVPDPG